MQKAEREKYLHAATEKKWQQQWLDDNEYQAQDLAAEKKSYVLVEFPYPSGEGLHVGHCLSYIAQDIIARYRRMRGENVLYPMGWDAFGLPAENYAIKHKIKPQAATAQNIANFKRQIQSLGISFDWSRELNTTDPAYYKWTQWIFLQLFKNGLAEKKEIPINWCPKDKIGLAFEEVIDGKCERCGTQTERRTIKQWVLKITKYADRLIKDLDEVNFLPEIKQQQINWIGRSEGAEIDFPLAGLQALKEAVFASNNKGKLQRMKHLFEIAGLSIALKMPEEIGVSNFDVEEDSTTLRENAEKKARALVSHTELPVFADDSGFFIDGAEIDPVMVKRNALAGVDEKKLTIEEIAERMQKYYQNIASSKGGSVEAEWRNALCLIMPGGQTKHIETIRPVLLTDESHGTVDPYLPLRGLYISKATNKYVLEQSEAEELQELQPITDGLKLLFSQSVRVFTTRPDTLFGATYLVLSPEHELLSGGVLPMVNKEEVAAYIKNASRRTDRDRQESKEKTGVELKGVAAVNPANQKQIPIWIADYVLSTYGTGAIMAVPAHDERDYEFAKKYKLPIIEVISSGDKSEKNLWTGEGKMINSDKFDSMPSGEAREAITKFVGGAKKTQYKLRDWIFSRQHYWGEPIPIVICETCGYVPLDEKDLPLTLPDVEFYEPTDTGESPLAKITNWVNTICPACGSMAKRETDTMPNWAGSSWYFMRYTDPHNDKALADKEKLAYWLPVDLYNGGAEHTTLHLLYSRFWYKFLYDIGAAPTKEPYNIRVQHGMILGPDNQKMSKSRGNVINPDAIIEKYGADVFRMYMMFMGEYDQVKIWSEENLQGVARFVGRLRRYLDTVEISSAKDQNQRIAVHKAVVAVTTDLERRSFNTAVSAYMICLNSLNQFPNITTETLEALLTLLAPFAPFLTEEAWHSMMQKKTSIHKASWPAADESLIARSETNIAVQINGKVRATISVQATMSEKEVQALAFSNEQVKKYISDPSKVKNFIYKEGRIISIVI